MGPHPGFNKTLRGELPPTRPEKFPHVMKLQEETRELYFKGLPSLDHLDGAEGVALLDLYQIFHSFNATSQVRGIRFKSGKTMFNDIWKRVQSRLVSDKIHTVVMTTDDGSRVPSIKQKEQKRRSKVRRNEPYPDSALHIVDDGFITGTSATPELIDGMKLMATRGGMRNLWSYFESQIMQQYIAPGRTVILDYDRSGPVEFRGSDGAVIRRVMEECIHPFGEADMSMIFWTKYFSSRAKAVIVSSIDGDVVPMFGWYMSHFEDVCPAYVYWVFGKEGSLVSVELHMLYDAIKKHFGHMNHFFAACILGKTDFHPGQAFTYNKGVHKIIEAMIESSGDLMQHTNAFERGDMKLDAYLLKTILAVKNDKNWMCIRCDEYKLANCLVEEQKKKGTTRISFPNVKKHTCTNCTDNAKSHTCFDRGSYAANWRYWAHQWGEPDRMITAYGELDRSHVLLDCKIHYVSLEAKVARKKKADAKKKATKEAATAIKEWIAPRPVLSITEPPTEKKKPSRVKVEKRPKAKKKPSVKKKRKLSRKKPVPKTIESPPVRKKKKLTIREQRKQQTSLELYHQDVRDRRLPVTVESPVGLPDSRLENKWVREEGMLMPHEL